MNRRYVLITPCRDEAAYLQTTIDTVAAQTIPPAAWIIVDDGSTDGTPDMLRRAAAEHSFIRVIRRDDRGRRSVGPGVIEAFNTGVNSIALEDFDYVCKFDGDLEMPRTYFQTLMEHFERDPWLGTASGKLFVRQGHPPRLVEERCGDENSVGPAKFYRTRCFQQIGGFVPQVSWDGIDGHMCRLHGWVARSFDDPALRIVHLRRMGSSEHSFWTGRVRWGRGKYFMGSSPLFVAAVGLYRMFERPYVLSGVGILWGYLKAMASGHERFSDPEYLRHFRAYERRSLWLGKRRTMNASHDLVRRRFPAPVRA